MWRVGLLIACCHAINSEERQKFRSAPADTQPVLYRLITIRTKGNFSGLGERNLTCDVTDSLLRNCDAATVQESAENRLRIEFQHEYWGNFERPSVFFEIGTALISQNGGKYKDFFGNYGRFASNYVDIKLYPRL